MDVSADLSAAIKEARLTAVFDLDGCLVHSSPDIAAALNAALAPHAVSFAVPEVERMVGDGLGALLDKALAARQLHVSQEEVKAVFAALHARYAEEPSARSEPREWIAEVARALHKHGARVAVATNKSEPIAVAIMDRLGLSPIVHAVVGHVAGRAKKPAAEPVALAVARAGGDLTRAVMVGDSAADLGAGRNAGLPVVLVTGGYGIHDARTLGADHVVSNGEELLSAVLSACGIGPSHGRDAVKIMSEGIG